jgi:hypothetical protein
MSPYFTQGQDGGTLFTHPDSSAALGYTLGITAADPVNVSASSVALFGCNTSDLASQYSSTTFTGVQSGSDGTELQTLDLAAASWVGAGGGQAGDTAAQSVINSSTFSTDQGDKVVTTPPKPPNQ